MTNMKVWPTYALLGVLIIMGGAMAYFSHKYNERQDALLAREGKESSETISYEEKPSDINTASSTQESLDQKDWRTIYPDTKPFTIKDTEVLASIADSWPERITGLSETPYLPESVVKLFVFESSGLHSIWMKDMNYPIDIMWLNEENEIVHIVENASPDSYPESFTPDEPSLYVVETVAGFVEKNKISEGDKMEKIK